MISAAPGPWLGAELPGGHLACDRRQPSPMALSAGQSVLGRFCRSARMAEYRLLAGADIHTFASERSLINHC